MKDYAYAIAAGLAFIAGLWLASAHYDRKIALMEAAQSGTGECVKFCVQ